MITKECFGSKEFSPKTQICKYCPYKFACKITGRRWKKEYYSSLVN